MPRNIENYGGFTRRGKVIPIAECQMQIRQAVGIRRRADHLRRVHFKQRLHASYVIKMVMGQQQMADLPVAPCQFVKNWRCLRHIDKQC